MSASQRIRCLGRCWWWVSPIEHCWEGWSLSSKKPNHGDDKVLPNCYRVSVQQASFAEKHLESPGITASAATWSWTWDSSHCMNCQEDVTDHQSRKKISLLTDEFQAQVIQKAGFERLVHTSIYRLTNSTILPKLMNASPWPYWSCAFHLNKQEIANNEDTLMSNETNNQRCSHCCRTWPSPCYGNHPILHAGLHICLQCTSICIQNP